MHVAFDQQVFSWQVHGGISRYYCELAARLAARAECRVSVIAPMHVNAYLGALPPGVVVGARVPQLARTGRARQLASAVLARGWLRAQRPDIVHETYYARRGAAARGAARVVTVFDMIHERFPADFPAHDDTRERKAAAVLRADRVICISESTRRDLLDLVAVDPARVSVVHLAGMPPATPAVGAPVPDGPFLLYVGQRSGYKNFAGLLRAVASSPALRGRIRVVAFGGGPLAAAERALIQALGLPADAVVEVAGDDAALAALYCRAALFVYPSRYEGFGLPPLEAMSYGCPVVCSGTSSLPEVVGDAAELSDPDRPESIAAAIERVLTSPERAAELRRRGGVRAATFTWDRCAAETLAIYEQAVTSLRHA